MICSRTSQVRAAARRRGCRARRSRRRCGAPASSASARRRIASWPPPSVMWPASPLVTATNRTLWPSAAHLAATPAARMSQSSGCAPIAMILQRLLRVGARWRDEWNQREQNDDECTHRNLRDERDSTATLLICCIRESRDAQAGAGDGLCDGRDSPVCRGSSHGRVNRLPRPTSGTSRNCSRRMRRGMPRRRGSHPSSRRRASSRGRSRRRRHACRKRWTFRPLRTRHSAGLRSTRASRPTKIRGTPNTRA